MGGSGASMWGIRSGHIFSNINSWVGVHIPRESPTFESSFEGVYGDSSWHLCYSNPSLNRFGYPQIRAEDSIDVWDYWDNTKWLKSNPSVDIPWESFGNGVNDVGIGWPQAWRAAKALEQSRQAYNFNWGQGGHNQRPTNINGTDRLVGITFRKNQSVPALSNCALNDSLGKEPQNAAPSGQHNQYIMWDVASIIDEPARWAIELWLIASAPRATATTDLTPRRLQKFIHSPGSRYHWSLSEGGSIIDSGDVRADSVGLITIENIELSKTSRRLVLECIGCVDAGSRNFSPLPPHSNLKCTYTRHNKELRIIVHKAPEAIEALYLYTCQGRIAAQQTHLMANATNTSPLVWEPGRVSPGLYLLKLCSKSRQYYQTVSVLN
jgi:hypothetical protein